MEEVLNQKIKNLETRLIFLNKTIDENENRALLLSDALIETYKTTQSHLKVMQGLNKQVFFVNIVVLINLIVSAVVIYYYLRVL